MTTRRPTSHPDPLGLGGRAVQHGRASCAVAKPGPAMVVDALRDRQQPAYSRSSGTLEVIGVMQGPRASLPPKPGDALGSVRPLRPTSPKLRRLSRERPHPSGRVASDRRCTSASVSITQKHPSSMSAFLNRSIQPSVSHAVRLQCHDAPSRTGYVTFRGCPVQPKLLVDAAVAPELPIGTRCSAPRRGLALARRSGHSGALAGKPNERNRLVRIFRIAIPASDIDGSRLFYERVLALTADDTVPSRLYFHCGDVILALIDWRVRRSRTTAANARRYVFGDGGARLRV